MTDDQTKCPHCGADVDEFSNGKWFDCGSLVGQQSILCEVRTLRAKVAAQQELLKEAAEVIDEAVGILGCGDDYDSLYVQRLSALHRTISAAL